MNQHRHRLALGAAVKAYGLRRSAKICLDLPCCIYDFAENAGVEIRFADLPSMEGVYFSEKPSIVISSLRPPGRQAFTCAHELAHHVYGHGEQFDELVEDRQSGRKYDQKEFVSDCFAGALLMPKTAVLRGMSARSLRPATLTAEGVYRIASWLGVGYTALLSHMTWVLGLLTTSQMEAFEKVRLPQIRESLLGFPCSDHLIVADEAWSGRSVDAQVSDLVLLPANASIEGDQLEVIQHDGKKLLACAVRPGIGRVAVDGKNWQNFVRVSKKNFVGLARFRHLQEVCDE